MSAASPSRNSTQYSSDRLTYLLRCMRISLLRRWLWVAVAFVAGFVVAQAFGLPLALSGLATTLVSLLVAAGIAVNSWSRHSGDFEARVIRR